MRKSVGTRGSVRYKGGVRYSECPLKEVSLYAPILNLQDFSFTCSNKESSHYYIYKSGCVCGWVVGWVCKASMQGHMSMLLAEKCSFSIGLNNPGATHRKKITGIQRRIRYRVFMGAGFSVYSVIESRGKPSLPVWNH